MIECKNRGEECDFYKENGECDYQMLCEHQDRTNPEIVEIKKKLKDLSDWLDNRISHRTQTLPFEEIKAYLKARFKEYLEEEK